MATLTGSAAQGGIAATVILCLAAACSSLEFTAGDPNPRDSANTVGGNTVETSPTGAFGGGGGETETVSTAGGGGSLTNGGHVEGGGGAITTRGASGESGESAGGEADGGAADGGGTALVGFDCTEHGGQEFGGHCYIEKGDVSSSADVAASWCFELGLANDRNAYLPVIDSAEEQAWLLGAWVAPADLTQDIWLGLRCLEAEHPDIDECGCSYCDATTRAARRSNWSWSTVGADVDGWRAGDPDGDGRCAALFTDPLYDTGWVDRDCDAASFEHFAATRTYRAICEIEL